VSFPTTKGLKVEIVDENSEPVTPLAQRGRPPTRNWDLWLQNNKTVRLTEGKDFTCKQTSLRTQIYQAAAARGGHANVSFGRKPDGRLTADVTYTSQNVQSLPEVIEDRSGLTDEKIDAVYRADQETDFDNLPVLEPNDEELDYEEVPLRGDRSNTSTYGKESLSDYKPVKWGPPTE
jgi:hypothetical protein